MYRIWFKSMQKCMNTLQNYYLGKNLLTCCGALYVYPYAYTRTGHIHYVLFLHMYMYNVMLV